MKLGHYLKIPPRILFLAQGSATVLGALTQVGVTLWMLGNISDICDDDQSNGWTCPNGRTVFSSSVIWGLLGTGRSYSIGTIYSGLLHFFWIGALMPVLTWLLWKYWTKKDGSGVGEDVGGRREWIRLINWPLIFVGTYNVPPATGINYSSWAMVNFFFNWWIKKKFFAWWCKSLSTSHCSFANRTQRNITTSWPQRLTRAWHYLLLSSSSASRTLGHNSQTGGETLCI